MRLLPFLKNMAKHSGYGILLGCRRPEYLGQGFKGL